MAERLKEFDPQGLLPPLARRIAAVLGDRIDELGKAAFEAYLANAQGKQHAPEELDLILRNACVFHHHLLNDFGGETWADLCRDFLGGAISRGLSIRTQIFTINAVLDKSREILGVAVEDLSERADLMRAMRQIALIQVELTCGIYADSIRLKDQQDRDRQRAEFSELLTNQIDHAAELGHRLRDQAREASTATRGMLDKASEVAAAAEQSAIAMREAAHTSSGLIRAIEEARTEVDQAAEVAARASMQAGEAVTMSATLSVSVFWRPSAIGA